MRKRLFVRNWIRRLLRYLCIPVGFFLVVFPLYSLMIRQTIQAQSSSAMEMLAIGTTQFERCLSNIRSTTNKLFSETEYTLLASSYDNSILGDYQTLTRASKSLQDKTYDSSVITYSYITFERNGIILDDRSAYESHSNFYPGALEYEDKMYGIPLEYNIEYGGMLVNDTLLKAKGLTVPKTWEELRKTAIEGTEHDGNIFQCKGFDFVNWDSVPYYFLAFILQQDADYMTADGKFDVTTDAAKTAFNELATMVTEDKVTDLEGLTGGADMEGYQQLYAGRNMIVPRGPWTISEGEQSFGLKLGTDFDYAAMPQYGNNQKFASENGWSLAVSSSCKEQEIALKFLEYLYQDDVMLEHNIRCTQIPAKKRGNRL